VTAPRYASDLIVDLMQEAGIEHVAFNPGATFRGIHDSLVNYALDGPQIVLCGSEGISVAAAQGYAKAAEKPMAALVHDIVGLQNASMAIYNAWCDRVPMLLIGGTGPRSKKRRRPWIDWIHTSVDQGALIRDFIKWDDEPSDIASISESFARGITATRSVPQGPVYLCYDVDLQEQVLPDECHPSGLAGFCYPTDPEPEPAAVRWLADRLHAAERPMVVAGHAGTTQESFQAVVALAEHLGLPVIDAGWRLAFPTSHELNVTRLDGILREADLIVSLDVDDIQGRTADVNAPLVNVGVGHLRLRGWSHDYHALPRAERHITSSADTTVRAILEAVREKPRPPAAAERAASIGQRVRSQRVRRRQAAAAVEAPGAVPLERLLYELARVLRTERYVLANGTNARSEHAFMDLDTPRQYLGSTAGGGLGYGLGAAIGCALAVGRETITVDVQPDGDLLFTPSALWTIAQLSLPILVVVLNNRQYGNSVEHAIKIARARHRSVENRYVGTGMAEPAVDFAGLARAFGVWATGPVSDVPALGRALDDALATLRTGRPALVDVVVPGF
jgi:acetolactate synthase-1/2/3 large subunit